MRSFGWEHKQQVGLEIRRRQKSLYLDCQRRVQHAQTQMRQEALRENQIKRATQTVENQLFSATGSHQHRRLQEQRRDLCNQAWQNYFAFQDACSRSMDYLFEQNRIRF